MNKRTYTANETGSIMLEYVIVLCAIGVAVLLFSNTLFYTGFSFGAQSQWGSVGQRFVAFYQRTLGGISLPVP